MAEDTTKQKAADEEKDDDLPRGSYRVTRGEPGSEVEGKLPRSIQQQIERDQAEAEVAEKSRKAAKK